jgi:hypothetical protein
MSYKTIFGGIIAYILLGLYVTTIIVAVLVASCLGQGEACKVYTNADFTNGMAITIATVGGLVSALVIAELAVNKPGEPLVARSLEANASERSKRILQITTLTYLAVWTFFGLIAFIYGFLLYPGILQPLTDIAQAWLGLAVAAAYAYLGINPKV